MPEYFKVRIIQPNDSVFQFNQNFILTKTSFLIFYLIGLSVHA